jgi:hypothetical protein
VTYLGVNDIQMPYELLTAWKPNAANPAIATFRDIATAIAGQLPLQRSGC